VVVLFVLLVYPVLILLPGTDSFAVDHPISSSVIEVWTSIVQRFSTKKRRKQGRNKKKYHNSLLSRLRHPAAYFLTSGGRGGESTPPDGESDEFEYMLRDHSDSDFSETGGDNNLIAARKRMFRLRSTSSNGNVSGQTSSSNFPLV